MRAIPVISMAILAALAGCNRPGPADQEAHEPANPTAPAGHQAPEAPGTVRIDPEMLRDLRITTATVESRDGGDGVTVLGEVGVDEDAYAEVGSPIEARVVRLIASIGDAVVPGRPLVEVQSPELGRARADFLTAQARMVLAGQTLERKRGLAAERIVPARELQEAEAEAASAKAQLESAGTVLRAMGVPPDVQTPLGGDASLFLVRSPIAGTVIARDALRGQIVDPARPLFRIADVSRLWLTVHAFERDAVRISPGTRARVSFPALPGRDFEGRVTLVGRQVEASSRTIPVRLEILNAEGLLRPGMSATAWVPVGDAGERIVSVPSACLQRMQEGWYVFLPRAEGLFEMREVGRGRDLGGEVEVVSGLEAGETIVVEGAFLLKAEAEKSRGEGAHHDH